MQIIFSKESFEDLIFWSHQDKKIHDKVISLIRDIQREAFKGLGKPEPLKYDYAGYWSRRISDEHRLVYKVEKEKIYSFL